MFTFTFIACFVVRELFVHEKAIVLILLVLL